MGKRRTEINPIRAERVKQIIEREGMTQQDFAKAVHHAQQNISKIINLKNALTEGTAQDIVNVFPKYNLEWLLGYSDVMLKDDLLDSICQANAKRYNDGIAAVRTLARLCDIDVSLYYQETGEDDLFIVRTKEKTVLVPYPVLNDLREDLAALTSSRLNRIVDKYQNAPI